MRKGQKIREFSDNLEEEKDENWIRKRKKTNLQKSKNRTEQKEENVPLNGE